MKCTFAECFFFDDSIPEGCERRLGGLGVDKCISAQHQSGTEEYCCAMCDWDRGVRDVRRAVMQERPLFRQQAPPPALNRRSTDLMRGRFFAHMMCRKT